MAFDPRVGYDDFYQALADGRVRFGQTVTHEELCGTLGMRLAQLRDTITLLTASDLVEVKKKVGITVFSPDIDFFRNNFQIRVMIERETIRHFARGTDLTLLSPLMDDHVRLIESVETANHPSDFAAGLAELEERLHYSIVRSVGNRLMSEMHRSTYRNLQLFRLAHPTPYTIDSQLSALREHAEVLQKCLERDASGAALALERHFSGVMSRRFGSP